MYLLCIMYLLFVFPFISQVLVENIKRKVEQSQFKWSNRAKIKPPQYCIISDLNKESRDRCWQLSP